VENPEPSEPSRDVCKLFLPQISVEEKFTIYALAQVPGAFCTAVVVYATYKSAIVAYEGGI